MRWLIRITIFFIVNIFYSVVVALRFTDNLNGFLVTFSTMNAAFVVPIAWTLPLAIKYYKTKSKLLERTGNKKEVSKGLRRFDIYGFLLVLISLFLAFGICFYGENPQNMGFILLKCFSVYLSLIGLLVAYYVMDKEYSYRFLNESRL